MKLIPETILSLLIEGENLHACVVRHSLARLKRLDLPRIDRFMALPSSARTAAVRGLPSSNRVVLTVPNEWCMVTPLDVTIDQWRRSKEQIAQSIESLLPISADQSLLGLIERAQDDETSPASYLMALRLSRATPWIAAIEDALARPVDMILAPQMALLGAGLPRTARVVVRHNAEDEGGSITLLRHGEIEELVPHASNHDIDSDIETRYDLVEGELHEVGGEPDRLPSRSRIKLAEGATLAPRVAPRRLAPFRGACPRPAPAWLAPTLIVVISAALVLMAWFTAQQRYERATDSLVAAETQRRSELALIQRNRAEHERLSQLIEHEIAARVASWRPVLPELQAAQDAMPDGAFLYRVRIGEGGVSLRGEALRASEILERLERDPAFLSPRTVDAPILVEERELEQFHIQAKRSQFAHGGDS